MFNVDQDGFIPIIIHVFCHVMSLIVFNAQVQMYVKFVKQDIMEILLQINVIQSVKIQIVKSVMITEIV